MRFVTIGEDTTMQPNQPQQEPIDPWAGHDPTGHVPVTGQFPATGSMPGTDPWAAQNPPAYQQPPPQYQQQPYQPPYAPNPGAAGERRKGLFVVVGVVAAIVLLAVAGGVVWLVGQAGGKGDAGQGGTPAAAVGWNVGSCIYVSKNSWTRPTPSPLTPEIKRAIEQSKQYSPIGCDDAKALAKITAVGTVGTAAGGQAGGDGCPDDTDLAVQEKSAVNGSSGKVYCTRNVKDPHPGDPGGGGGAIVAGDCVYVGSTNAARALNDQIAEEACAEGYFGKVTARAADKQGCPAETITRVEVKDAKGGVLCLVQGDGKSYIAKPGDCVNWPGNQYTPATRDDCGRGPGVFGLAGFADDAKGCPAGSTGRQHTGYDRFLCLKSR
ncbi:hypothetical protein [Dactylosporangium sp. CS-033363]|uniref:hypothetical protein n=1 Tax=Dactylosporangium sp. CS-033363 TaxID=3239935 RepID=UPI003D8E675E